MWPVSPLFYNGNPATIPSLPPHQPSLPMSLPKLPLVAQQSQSTAIFSSTFPPMSPLSDSLSDTDSSNSSSNTPQPNSSTTSLPITQVESFSSHSTVYSPLSEDYTSPASPLLPFKADDPAQSQQIQADNVFPGGQAAELLRNSSLGLQTTTMPERKASITALISSLAVNTTNSDKMNISSSSLSSSSTLSSSSSSSAPSSRKSSSQSHTKRSCNSSPSIASPSSSASSTPFDGSVPRKRKRWCPEKQKNYDRKRRLEEGKALNSLAALLAEMDDNGVALAAAGGQHQQTRANVMAQAVETIQQLTASIQEMETSIIQCEAMEQQLQPAPVSDSSSHCSTDFPPSADHDNDNSAVVSASPSYFWASDNTDPDALILSCQHSLDSKAPDSQVDSNVRVYLKTLRSSLSALLSKFHSRISPTQDQEYLSLAIYSDGFVVVCDLGGRVMDANPITYELLSKDSQGRAFDATDAVKGKINCSIFVHLQFESLLPLFEVGCDEEAIFCALLFSAQKHSPHEKNSIPAEHERFLLENLMRVRGQATPRDVLQCMRACSPNVAVLKEFAALLSGRKNLIGVDLYGYGLNGAVLKIRLNCWTLQKPNPAASTSSLSASAAKTIPYAIVLKFNMQDCAFVTAVHRSECALNIEKTFLTEVKKAQMESAGLNNSRESSVSSSNGLLAALASGSVSPQNKEHRHLSYPLGPKDPVKKAEDYRTKMMVVLGASQATFLSGTNSTTSAISKSSSSSASQIDYAALYAVPGLLDGELMSDEEALFAYNKKLTNMNSAQGSQCGITIKALDEHEFPYKKFQRTPAAIFHARLHALGIPHRHHQAPADDPDGHGDHPSEWSPVSMLNPNAQFSVPLNHPQSHGIDFNDPFHSHT